MKLLMTPGGTKWGWITFRGERQKHWVKYQRLRSISPAGRQLKWSHLSTLCHSHHATDVTDCFECFVCPWKSEWDIFGEPWDFKINPKLTSVGAVFFWSESKNGKWQNQIFHRSQPAEALKPPRGSLVLQGLVDTRINPIYLHSDAATGISTFRLMLWAFILIYFYFHVTCLPFFFL